MRNSLVILFSIILVISGCAIGGKGGRDGGDASVEIGDIEGKVEACVGTTANCKKGN